MAAGARPNVDLARDAGIEIGPRGGIVVDAQMRTSAPDIFAAGDAVETAHLLTGEPTLSMLAGPAYDLEHLELAYAPPYGSAKDPVNMAGFLGSNLLRGDIDLWYPEDYPDCADQVTILDTRTQAEYDTWHITEAVLIPYTELRERLDEVSRDKPVYTYCRSGFRSYIAYCVLKQNGFDEVAFLSGGMMTYHGYHRTPLTVGTGGMPMVAHAEDEVARRPGALEHV
jgi:rhodanese-related sulfurtransferase